MRRLRQCLCAVLLPAVLAAFAAGAGPARAATEVDLLLVLAVDVSYSMDLEEQKLQREGYVAALRDPLVQKAIASGPTGRIAVTYFEWAGPDTHRVVVPWTLVDGAETAEAVASTLMRETISRARMTSISSGLEFAGEMLGSSPFRAARRVVDVSGDGPNNAGLPVTEVRDRLLQDGVVINGLPILLKLGTPRNVFDIADLDDYYSSCVVGGPGSFVIPINKLDEFAMATRQKLLLEVSSAPPVARVMPAQLKLERKEGYDCLVGEKRMRRTFEMWRN